MGLALCAAALVLGALALRTIDRDDQSSSARPAYVECIDRLQREGGLAYDFVQRDDRWRASNAAHGLELERKEQRLHVRGDGVEMSVEVLRITRPGDAKLSLLDEHVHGDGPALTARVEHFTQQLLNGPVGIEHRFVFEQRLPGHTPDLEIVLSLHGPVSAHLHAEGEAIELSTSDGAQLRYVDWAVYDARGARLPTSLHVGGQSRVLLQFEDTGAHYPVWASVRLTHRPNPLAGERVPEARLGSAVALDADTALVGAESNELGAARAGTAYVYVRRGDQWALHQRLTARDRAKGDRFGASVALAGDTAVVGAPGASPSGAAYVFARDDAGQWIEQAKLGAEASEEGARPPLQPPLQSASSGAAVALAGDTVFVAAPGASREAGVVHAFVRGSGDQWLRRATLVAQDAAPLRRFGSSLASDGHLLIVGAAEAAQASGSAYLFARGDDGRWVQQAQLTASDRLPLDFFGASVAVDDDIAIVGAPGVAEAAGAAYLFSRDATDGWSEQQRLEAPVRAAGAAFGSAVDLAGQVAIVGAASDDFRAHTRAGAAHLFVRSGDQGEWSHRHVLHPWPDDRGTYFGATVATSGQLVLVGAPGPTLRDRGSAPQLLSWTADVSRIELATAADACHTQPARSANAKRAGTERPASDSERPQDDEGRPGTCSSDETGSSEDEPRTLDRAERELRRERRRKARDYPVLSLELETSRSGPTARVRVRPLAARWRVETAGRSRVIYPFDELAVTTRASASELVPMKRNGRPVLMALRPGDDVSLIDDNIAVINVLRGGEFDLADAIEDGRAACVRPGASCPPHMDRRRWPCCREGLEGEVCVAPARVRVVGPASRVTGGAHWGAIDLGSVEEGERGLWFDMPSDDTHYARVAIDSEVGVTLIVPIGTSWELRRRRDGTVTGTRWRSHAEPSQSEPDLHETDQH